MPLNLSKLSRTVIVLMVATFTSTAMVSQAVSSPPQALLGPMMPLA